MAYRGGAATWRRYVRFKHLATDLYLTVVPLSSLEQETRRPSVIKHNDENGDHRYACVENDENSVYVLAAKEYNDPAREESLLFSLDPCAKTSTKESRVPINSFVRLQHVNTGTWIHTTDPSQKQNLYHFSKNEKGWVKVVCEDVKIDKEAFALSPVSPNEVRDLDFANDASRALNLFVELIKSGRTVGKEPIKYEAREAHL
ncbi:cation channel family protein [Aphelenchoides avenae]|nr:cation channel family protein [Aphelenchus avenae]